MLLGYIVIIIKEINDYLVLNYLIIIIYHYMLSFNIDYYKFTYINYVIRFSKVPKWPKKNQLLKFILPM